MQSVGSYGALSPVVHGDIALAIDTNAIISFEPFLPSFFRNKLKPHVLTKTYPPVINAYTCISVSSIVLTHFNDPGFFLEICSFYI